jgi:hypothetical protein
MQELKNVRRNIDDSHASGMSEKWDVLKTTCQIQAIPENDV